MKKFLLASAALVVLGGSMFADTVTSTVAGSGFYAFPTGFATSTPTWINNATPPTTAAATPFWNDPSDDAGVGGSHLMNIGYLLTDTGGFTGTTPVLGTDTVADDYTTGNGTTSTDADPSAFNFVRNTTAYNITLLYANSGDDTGNAPAVGTVGTQFGYYVGTTYTAIYNVGLTTSPTGTQAFNPTTSGNSYGFYATVCYVGGGCETYTTGGTETGTSTTTAWNHFAVFELASGNYVIGFTGQNGYYGEEDGDYQDVTVELSAVTPEPATFAFMGLGLAGLGFLGRRRRFAKK